MMHKLVRGGLLFFCVCAGTLLAVNDEPEGLNWDSLSQNLQAFQHFKKYQSSHPVPGNQPVGKCPASFPAVTVKPSDFINTGEEGWKLAEHNGRQVQLCWYGHTRYTVHAPLKITEAGGYRVWVKYFHVNGYAASFRMGIRPGEMLHQLHPQVVSTKGSFYEHNFDWSVHSSKLPVLPPDMKKLPSDFLWENGGMVELAPGDYTLELSTLIHGGPYTFRRIAMIVLTADPLVQGIDELAGHSSFAASDPIRADWELWEKRPGARPWEFLSSEQQAYYLEWKKDFMHKLAVNPENDDEKRLSYLSYFDEEYNLIGTPANIEKERKSLQAQLSKSLLDKYIRHIEAEDMSTDGGWSVADKENANGKVLFTSYFDGLATASTTVNIPRPGKYLVWARHYMLTKYYSLFDLSFKTADGRELPQLDYGFNGDRSMVKNFDFNWECRSIELPAGKLTFTLRKNRGKSPYTSRYVDRFIITDAEGVAPDDLRQRLSDQETALWLQKNPWNGFSRWSVPDAADLREPRAVNVRIPQNDVASMMLHFRNESGRALQVTPKVLGKVPMQLRLISYLKTAEYGWTPAVLLERESFAAPAAQNTSLWITIPTAGLSLGRHQVKMQFWDRIIDFNIEVTKPAYKREIPLVGGWCAPLRRESCWQLFKEIGINLLSDNIITKEEMKQYGIRHLNLGIDFKNENTVRDYLKLTRGMGLDYADWSAFLYDEPNPGTVAKWLTAAKATRKVDPKVQIWCNPGEIQSCPVATVLQMKDYIDVFCPYANHFTSNNQNYRNKELPAIGKIKLLYTTPCFTEKAANSPLDMIYLGDAAATYKRDGWSCFSLYSCYPYSNSIWDEIYPLASAQSVSYYPGAYGRTLSTRHLEAVREAVQRYRNGTTATVK